MPYDWLMDWLADQPTQFSSWYWLIKFLIRWWPPFSSTSFDLGFDINIFLALRQVIDFNIGRNARHPHRQRLYSPHQAQVQFKGRHMFQCGRVLLTENHKAWVHQRSPECIAAYNAYRAKDGRVSWFLIWTYVFFPRYQLLSINIIFIYMYIYIIFI